MHWRYTTCTLFPYTTLFRSLAAGLGWMVQHDGPARSPSIPAAVVRAAREARLSLLLVPADVSVAQDSSFMAHRLTAPPGAGERSEEHTSQLQSREKLVCRLL